MGLLDDAIREHLDLKRQRGADPTEIERLEREALGPVRRERSIGVPQVEVQEQYEPGRLTGEEPTSYHDPTAPEDHGRAAPTLNLAGGHEPGNGASAVEEDAAPKRRGFLRRRPAPEPEALEEHHGELEYGEGTVQFDALLHDEPVHDDDPLLHDEPLPRAEEPEHADLPVPQPPPLAFEAPPERPRFTPEPPTTIQPVHIDDEEPVEPPPAPSDLHEAPPAPAVEPAPRGVGPAPRRVEPAPRGVEPAPPERTPPPVAPAPPRAEPQPTREFDVLGEPSTEGEADAGADAHAEQEEDVLEETPEFLQDTPEHDRLWFEHRPPRDFDFDG